MPHRTIKDADGVTWRVLDVFPSLAERRSIQDRRQTPRDLPDRRRGESAVPSFQVGGAWLAFVSASERRRLMLVPERRDELSNEDLLMLLDRAADTARPRGGDNSLR